MKTIWKKLAVLCTLLCVTLSFGILAACGETPEPGPGPGDGDGDTDTEITYTVYVKLPDDTPAENVSVQWCVSGVVGGACYGPVATDASGKASIDLEPAVYDVHVLLSKDLDALYTYSDTYQTTAAGGELTITLVEKQAPPPAFDNPTGGTGASNAPYVVTNGRFRALLTAQNDTVYFSFSAAQAGVYTVTADGKDDAVIAGDALDTATGEFTVDALQINTAFTFSVTLDGDVTEDTEIPVVFARKGDITVKPERTVGVRMKGFINAVILETELVKVPYTATLVKDNRGVYHLGDANGAAVLVNLKNAVPPFDKALNALDAEDYIYTVADTEHASDVNYPTIKNDYSLMINGAPYENIDGYVHHLGTGNLCVLTEELEGFLKLFAAKNAAAIKANDNTATDATVWYFALYTYTPAKAIDLEELYDSESGEPTGTPITVNASVPAGKSVYYSISQALPMGGEYTISSDDPNAKAFYNGTPYGGTGEGFEFTAAVDGIYPKVAFAITTANEQAGTITFTVADASTTGNGDGSQFNPFVLVLNTPVSITLALEETPMGTQIAFDTWVTFTAETAGRYQITFTETGVEAGYQDSNYEFISVTSSDEFIITLEANEIFDFSFFTNGTERLTFDVTIEYLGA